MQTEFAVKLIGLEKFMSRAVAIFLPLLTFNPVQLVSHFKHRYLYQFQAQWTDFTIGEPGVNKILNFY
jgi:hypothetical protein